MNNMTGMQTGGGSISVNQQGLLKFLCDDVS